MSRDRKRRSSYASSRYRHVEITSHVTPKGKSCRRNSVGREIDSKGQSALLLVDRETASARL